MVNNEFECVHSSISFRFRALCTFYRLKINKPMLEEGGRKPTGLFSFFLFPFLTSSYHS